MSKPILSSFIFAFVLASRVAAAEARLTRFDLYTADEAFVTGTGAELMPLTTADGRPIGDGRPGPLTRRLTEAFHALVRSEGDPLW